MIKHTLFSGLALAALGGLLFSSCTNSTSPGTTVGAPSNVMAVSSDASTISIKWTRDAGDATPDTVIVSPSVGTPIISNGSTAQLTGLSSGSLYTITVASSGGRSSSIQWMTAIRTTGLQLYEFSSANKSALVLNGATGHAQVVSASSTNAPTMDFYLEDVQHDPSISVPSGLSFEGAQFLDGNGVVYRNSAIDTAAHYVPGGLDSDYSSMSYSTQWARMGTPGYADSVGNTYDIPDASVYGTTGSRVLLVRTQDNNFAKIEIVPAANGQLFSGSGTNKYITVNVSYQPMANQPYAARPNPNPGVRPAVRISAH